MSDLIPGILFDLDGTLLDTAPEFTHCLNTLLAEAGKNPVNVGELRDHVSLGVKGMLKFGFGSSLSDNELLTLTEQFLSSYERGLGALTQPFPGILALVDWLEANHIPWGVVTNKARRFAEPLIQQFPSLRKTKCLISGDTLPVSKPDPAPILAACTQLGMNPTQSWYIGDALADVQASRRAGLKCAIAQYGYIPKEVDLISWEADHHFTDPKDLIALISG